MQVEEAEQPLHEPATAVGEGAPYLPSWLGKPPPAAGAAPEAHAAAAATAGAADTKPPPKRKRTAAAAAAEVAEAASREEEGGGQQEAWFSPGNGVEGAEATGRPTRLGAAAMRKRRATIASAHMPAAPAHARLGRQARRPSTLPADLHPHPQQPNEDDVTAADAAAAKTPRLGGAVTGAAAASTAFKPLGRGPATERPMTSGTGTTATVERSDKAALVRLQGQLDSKCGEVAQLQRQLQEAQASGGSSAVGRFKRLTTTAVAAACAAHAA